ncbi:MAG: PD-(D/E)XK nuclease domain-containing protein [Candidatus Cardinium sp.]|uniref:PD-(D/E)XK nuclease domain-containing protein n=1 Tax=Cardinium endosymbiont of Dermatophagoides farinae TaxID=2597823 RepID=UPI001184055E|nr:PD-(D/E)XK nuclease domain-containing protein [Cardinium endosymbiont of Dermatophagoides farinae]TSJ80846.1 hypothetical protein FPG78_02190 [Cardinium endosymbiont of Dermatophagoides farinae]UWW96851.1 MAG: PD-(D/E)XK nuclease domain-containing protein [Candidatus Cardinium sp.]
MHISQHTQRKEHKQKCNTNRGGKIALEQIKSNGYYKPYLLRQKAIILLGINFNEESRMIDNWDYEIHEEHLEE